MSLIKIGDKRVFAEASTTGSNLLRFSFHGLDIIFHPTDVGGKSRGGIFGCLPFFGSHDDFPEISNHGWMRNQELEVENYSFNRLVLRGTNQGCGNYPWQLKYSMATSILREGCLAMTMVVERLNDGIEGLAPVNLGFHPYFCASQEKDGPACMVSVGNRIITSFHQTAEIIPVDGPIIVRSGNRLILMTLVGAFNASSRLALWSDDPTKYFCVEPMQTHPDAFNNAKYGRFLAQGERIEITMYLMVM